MFHGLIVPLREPDLLGWGISWITHSVLLLEDCAFLHAPGKARAKKWKHVSSEVEKEVRRTTVAAPR